MKLFMNKNEKYEEPEVHMFFHKQTKEVEQVEKFVRSLSITIPAKYEDEIYKLYPTDIYYIETIDRRTYLYTASRVYQSSEKLLSLEKLLEAADKGNKWFTDRWIATGRQIKLTRGKICESGIYTAKWTDIWIDKNI